MEMTDIHLKNEVQIHRANDVNLKTTALHSSSYAYFFVISCVCAPTRPRSPMAQRAPLKGTSIDFTL